tara:strand:- start:613 stop:1938 length:1326 start_codon:yes stop_codon:yes gene_type:complete
MSKIFIVKKRVKKFNKEISVPGDKSLSIRWLLFASLAKGVSTAKNLLMSDDVKATIHVLKKLGIKIIEKNNKFNVYGRGLDGYNYKKNLTINAENSGTLGRLILGLLVNTPNKIKLIGDESLSKRDFKRVSDPLSKFGVLFKLKKNKYLPLTILGSANLSPIRYVEKRGSAQCKSAVILAAIRTNGTTVIKARKSRNHTELMCKHLGLPVYIKKKGNFDIIKIKKPKEIKTLNYNIPSDISSGAFFIVLTALSKNSELTIKNVNINPSRIGIITILKKMGVKISFKNKKSYKGEKIADIKIKSSNNLNAINCPSNLNSGAIDEFLVIFLVAAKAKGVSYFKNLNELNQKESPRLEWAQKILTEMGIKSITTNNSIKIFGNPNLTVNKKIIIKNYLKDHRIFMTSVVAALSFGGKWIIHDKNSVNTSFPNFFKILKKLTKDD